MDALSIPAVRNTSPAAAQICWLAAFLHPRENVEYDLSMNAIPTLPRTLASFWIASIWFGIALFDSTQTVVAMHAEGMHHAWARLFVTGLLSWLPWALATPLIALLGRRYPPLHLRPLTTWLTHLGACAGISLISAAWSAGLEKLLNPYAIYPAPPLFIRLLSSKFYSGILSALILYAFILAIGYALDSRERLTFQRIETARLNEQLSQAQLDALRRQIEPHFLFNTLNAIAGLVREKKSDDAVSMIAALSDFLRRTLEENNRQRVPLGEELEFLQKYLDIQKVRFADRLEVSLDVPSHLSLAQVPFLILQPVVENAIKHGIAKRAQGGAIRIAAFRSNGMLKLNVYNDGPSLPENWEKTRPGIGITNMRTRLESLYGDSFELSLRNQGSTGVELSVSLPFSKK
jgi:two-component system LytT family sensor kinase